MMVALLMTDKFRSNTKVPRWRDPVWLMWLAVPLYLVHQFEEYSLPVWGLGRYAIQDMIARNLGFPPYPDCPIPLAFYPVVNIALMWFGAPLAAYLGRRNVLIGFSFWGLIFANGLLHTVGGVTQRDYNAGQLTGAILFLPLSVWVIYASSFRGPCSGKVVGVSFAIGAVTHALLFMGYGFFKAGVFGGAGLLAYAVMIGFMPIILASLVSRFFKPELLAPVHSLQGAP